MDFLFNNGYWYIYGILLGLFVPLLLVVGNKLFGLSSSIVHLCSIILPRSRDCYRSISNGGIINLTAKTISPCRIFYNRWNDKTVYWRFTCRFWYKICERVYFRSFNNRFIAFAKIKFGCYNSLFYRRSAFYFF